MERRVQLVIGLLVAGMAAYVVATQGFAPDSVDEDGYTELRPSVVADRVMHSRSQQLSADESDGLRYLREAEMLGHDVNTALFHRHTTPVFSRVADAEQTHAAALDRLLRAYGVQDPVQPGQGSYTHPELRALYVQLRADGNASTAAALRAGATVQERQIRSLQSRLDATRNTDLTMVYRHLLRGARNHLRIYHRALEARNVSYTPQELSPQDYHRIVSQPIERGSLA